MRVQIDDLDGGSLIKLNGDIDESIESLGEALGKARGQRWVFDCSGIRKINSMGSSQWITILKSIPQDVEYVFRNCPLSFVDMAVMVPSFIQQRRIESLFVPYHCGDCSHEEQSLYHTDQAEPVAERLPCPKCGGAMEADEDVYDDLEALSEMGAA